MQNIFAICVRKYKERLLMGRVSHPRAPEMYCAYFTVGPSCKTPSLTEAFSESL